METVLGPDQCAYVSCKNFDADQGFNRHNRGGNYLFCDGHVKWHQVGGVRYAMFLPGASDEQRNLCENGEAECIDGVNNGRTPTFAVRPVGTSQKVSP
ncbi:MAG: hypothetical protein H7145_04635 [Akkermansiaceae bacterium]|nr:hypothetical protein [Armatimonadota bacterium]